MGKIIRLNKNDSDSNEWVDVCGWILNDKSLTDDELVKVLDKINYFDLFVINYSNKPITIQEYDTVLRLQNIILKHGYQDKFLIIDSDVGNVEKPKIFINYNGEFISWVRDYFNVSNLRINFSKFEFKNTNPLNNHFLSFIGRETNYRKKFNKFFLDNKLDKISKYSYNNMSEVLINGDSVSESEWNLSFCNIIFDTFFQYDICPYHHFNEKIAKPMLSNMPFIIYGVPHQLKILKELGFKTFHEYWDETYDDIIDTDDRFNKLNDLVMSISRKSKPEIRNMYYGMQEILNHNNKLIKKHMETSVFHKFLHSRIFKLEI